MKRMTLKWLTSLAAFLVLLTLGWQVRAAPGDTVLLLLPDGIPAADQRVGAWRDAAREEGIQLELVSDSQFMGLGASAQQYRGLVLPDQLHVRASDALVAALQRYVAAGGQVMLVYDFGALTDAGFYSAPRSRLSTLAGVDYVLYEELRESTIGLGHVTGMESTLWKLGVPPGKSMPYQPSAIANMGAQVRAQTQSKDAHFLGSDAYDPGGLKDFDHGRIHRYQLGEALQRMRGKLDDDLDRSYKAFRGKKTPHTAARLVPTAPSDDVHGLSGYVYGFLTYPSFVTRGEFAGEPLLASPDFGLAVGVNRVGAGKVLFVNLPLSYLKGQTDGMLMHGFLRYFAVDMLKMPALAKMPRARGGLVLNWHVDDGQAISDIATLAQYGVWNEGPYSMHFTAGPDVDALGDGLGMDLPNNVRAQNWMKYLAAKGNQIASHGGWIHNIYGDHANDSNEAEFLPYLVLNRDAVVSVIRRPLTEYSAPQGNNPRWALDWLEAEGILGYYTGAQTGLSFTRNYQGGQLTNGGMWAFPVLPFGSVATFEEFADLGLSEAQISGWYRKLADFSAVSRSSYLVYMHPPGAVLYPRVVVNFLSRAKALKAADRFEWYTMTELARFAQRHLQTEWSTSVSSKGTTLFTAVHPSSLADMTWLLSADIYSKPRVTRGYAKVYRDGGNYLVTAQGGRVLEFSAPPAKRPESSDGRDDDHDDDHGDDDD